MKPIRKETNREIAHDSLSGSDHPAGFESTEHVLTDEGAIESRKTTERISCVCGCLKPPGGFCAACGQPACIDCFGTCCVCSKPVCPRHGQLVDSPEVRRYCRPCFETLSRKRIARGLVRALLSPFVEWKEGER